MMKYVLVLVLLAAATVTTAKGACKDEPDESKGTCVIDGVTYQYNERIPTDDPCEECHCHDQSTPLCVISYCELPKCQQGYQVVFPKDRCCPYCQPIPQQVTPCLTKS
ncbi:von Willebrand factor C domain-containing protein 2-like isoform X2 [Physella acuta]|nr:von Willebrand factor C domain-containing protein 2-like isoform X2 [Physella acuta]XP_059179481.1 von Willebrand factor C domain-containing protein 2-like isoform X2 [Physella acuta]XP_059179482.1 von Willebrand factor C domain-containing protein 2-like isoform X2 [Physella acuta]